MRIETLNSLTDDELGMLLVVVNTEPPLPITEVSPNLLLYYRDDALTWKLSRWSDRVKPEFRSIFDQLMAKLTGNKPTEPSPDETPAPPVEPSTDVTSSIAATLSEPVPDLSGSASSSAS